MVFLKSPLDYRSAWRHAGRDSISVHKNSFQQRLPSHTTDPNWFGDRLALFEICRIRSISPRSVTSGACSVSGTAFAIVVEGCIRRG